MSYTSPRLQALQERQWRISQSSARCLTESDPPPLGAIAIACSARPMRFSQRRIAAGVSFRVARNASAARRAPADCIGSMLMANLPVAGCGLSAPRTASLRGVGRRIDVPTTVICKRDHARPIKGELGRAAALYFHANRTSVKPSFISPRGSKGRSAGVQNQPAYSLPITSQYPTPTRLNRGHGQIVGVGA